MSSNALLDKDFLLDLTTAQEREIYCKIIALNFDECPLEEITGNVSSGSISIDGTSSIRRSCSISLIAQELNIHAYYWGLHTKIKVFIGMKNNINSKYDDIIWFPQGIYILTSFSTSQSTTGWTVSLSGKDKMCLLNGEVGGIVNSLSWDFGKIDIENTDENGNGLGTYSKSDFLLKDIITEAVHLYAKEPYHNIIINDLDDVGLELLEYRGTEPLYFLVNQITNEVVNYSFDGDQGGYYICNENNIYELSNYTLATIPVYDNRIELDFGSPTEDPTIIYAKIDNNYIPYTVIKATYGDVVGYRITDLTYSGDLIVSVGTSIVNGVLEPIVKMLGDFEYFYNLLGQFVFQKKKTYVNTVWNNIVKNQDNEVYATNAMQTSSSIYTFENGNLITSFSNNPDLANVKNDYSIWGTRVGASAVELPIHLRYAIDKKPTSYTSYEGITYVTAEDPISEAKAQLKQEIEETLEQASKYKKQPNPNGLPEDWWEIQDWANYYLLLTGHYPIGTIGDYANEGKRGGPSICLDSYFNIAKNGYYQNYAKGQIFNLYIFDVDYDVDFEGSVTIGYTGHGCGCGHLYQYFLERTSNHIGTSYIYKPLIPTFELEEGLNRKVSELMTDVVLQKYKYNCEWRELIYQMARDNSLYGHNEDFLATIAANNPEEYPTGITGYEQYYTDIYSFWRDLYNPVFNPFQIYLPKDISASYAKTYYKELVEGKRLYIKDFDENYVLVTDEMNFNENLQYFLLSDIDTALTFPTGENIYQPKPDGGYDVLSYADVIKTITPTTSDNIDYYYKLDGVDEYAKYELAYESQFGDSSPKVRNDIVFYKFIKYSQPKYFDVNTIYYDENFNAIETDMFDINKTYYVKEGFKNVSSFERGKTYYFRDGNVKDGFSYKKAFSIDEDKDYFLGSGELVTSFVIGNSYYINNGKTLAFTILDRTYYEDKGFTPVFNNDDSFYLNGDYFYYDENKVKVFNTNKIKLGTENFVYSPYSEEELVDMFNNAMPPDGEFTGYVKLGNEFYPYKILLKTSPNKKYYTYKNNKYELIKHLHYKPIGTKTETGVLLTQEYYFTNKYNKNNGGWTIDLNTPEELNFWFDFLDTEGELSQYSVPNIGDRPKSEKDDNVKSIYYREVPNVIFVDNDDDLALQKMQKQGYTFVKLNKNLEQLFSISTRKKSAKDALDNLLYLNSYCSEEIIISCLPVYHLEPNTRILVHDDNSNINGEYIITKLSIPLSYNGTMSINATKAVERIY